MKFDTYTVIIIYSLICAVIVTVGIIRKFFRLIRTGIVRKELAKMYKEKTDLPFYPKEIPPDEPPITTETGLKLVQNAQKESDEDGLAGTNGIRLRE